MNYKFLYSDYLIFLVEKWYSTKIFSLIGILNICSKTIYLLLEFEVSLAMLVYSWFRLIIVR